MNSVLTMQFTMSPACDWLDIHERTNVAVKALLSGTEDTALSPREAL